MRKRGETTMRTRRGALVLILFGAVLLAAYGRSSLPVTAHPPNPQATHGPQEQVFDSAWARDPLWDDGQAEVALYEARRPQYGKIRSYESLFIAVKEDFNPQLHVKADPPYDGNALVPVIKLNVVHSYWTENYPYHFLMSAFVRREDPVSLVKLSLGSQEWCGNTYKAVRTWGARPELEFHTYFDGEGDGTRPLDLHAGDLLEDQLPLTLRGLKFTPGLTFHRRILPSLISNNLRQPPQWADATISVIDTDAVKAGARTIPAWRLNLKMGEVEQSWWFEKSAPHILLKMESSDGRSWLLKSRTRKAYWRFPTFRPRM